MKKFLQLTTILTFIACSNSNTLTVELSNANGLTTSSPVYSNGLEIDKVDHLMISGNRTILATIKLSGELQEIPSNSKFFVTDDGLLGAKALEINLGNGAEYFKTNDTIPAFEFEPMSSPDSEFEFSFLKSFQKIDSILIELRRLNQNLEDKKYSSPSNEDH